MLHVPGGHPENDAALLLTTEDVCSICLDALQPGAADGPRVTALPCGHAYHAACLAGWERKQRGLQRAARCAICQREYGPPPAPPSPARAEVRIDVRREAAEGRRTCAPRGPREAVYAALTVTVLSAAFLVSWGYMSRP